MRQRSLGCTGGRHRARGAFAKLSELEIHSARSPNVAFFRPARVGTRRSTLKLCSSASCLHINVGHSQSNSLSTEAIDALKLTAQTTSDIQSLRR